MMNWDDMAEYEEYINELERLYTNDYTGELLTFTEFDFYMRDIEGC